jgi:large subunit ribosomal protein L33
MSQSKYKERLIKLKCTDCKAINYYAHKNKKLVERKIELKKYCKKCRKHTVHKEMKKI